MSRTWFATDDEGLLNVDHLMSQKWMEGCARGTEHVASWILERAAAAFMKGSDEEAQVLRALAARIPKELTPELKAQAEKHALDYPFRVKEGE